jgi:adenosylcobinamide-GDP ribazoletransferase
VDSEKTASKPQVMLKTVLDCAAFLTLLPFKTGGTLTASEMGRFPACYPAVGLILGLCSFVLAALLGWSGLPAPASAILLVAAQIVLTRGFHLDGLADTADALLSHRPLERKLEILKDSHVGVFGVLAIVLDVALKASLLTSLAVSGRFPPRLVILLPVWGRLTASVVAARSRPVGTPGGLGHNMVAHSGLNELFAASLFSLALSLFFGVKTLLCAILAMAAGFPLTWLWRRALNGVSGDLLGASVELGEVLTLLFFAVIGPI